MKIVEVGNRRLLFIMAVEAEYGPELRRRFEPLFTGVGPVEAAVTASAALAGLAVDNRLPDLVVNLGSAGSARLQQAEVFQVARVSYRDMDASALGFAPGLTPFLDLPAELELLAPLLDVPAKRLSTGANIVSGAAYAKAVHIVRERCAAGGEVTLAQVRDATGSSRKVVQALLERMDADGITRRTGDTRIVRRGAAG